MMLALLASPSPCAFALSLLLLLPSFISAHIVITYPGWRENNLHTNGSVVETNGLGRGGPNNDQFPFGQQWLYPCGGVPMSQNRTKWPVKGGAVGIQPGWFSGHQQALIYINLGEGTNPTNYSLVMQPMFGITGPTNDLYPGSICMPQVPLPANFTAVVGANATIQVIEAAQHGAALYSCVDITFAEPEDVAEVNKANCENSSNIKFDYVFSTTSLTSDASSRAPWTTWTTIVPLAVGAVLTMMI